MHFGRDQVAYQDVYNYTVVYIDIACKERRGYSVMILLDVSTLTGYIWCPIILNYICFMLRMQAKYDVKRGKVSKARQESVTGCKIIAITVIVTLTIFPSLMIPLIFLVFL